MDRDNSHHYAQLGQEYLFSDFAAEYQHDKSCYWARNNGQLAF
jgi:hypothetical protein